MKVKDLLEKLSEYLPDLEIAIAENFDEVCVLSQDWDFMMKRFGDDNEKPFYKLVITPKLQDGQTAYEYFKSIQDDLDEMAD